MLIYNHHEVILIIMDFYEMETFIALSKTLHFKNCAEEMNLTPSAVSRLVKRLEEETGQNLIKRYRSNPELTEEGLDFLEFCKESINRFTLLQNSWPVTSGKLKGKLRIFCSVTAAYSVVNKLLPELKKKHPAIEIVLVTGSVDSAIEKVMSGEVDVAVAVKPQILNPKILHYVIQETKLRIIAPVNPLFEHNLLKDFNWGKSRVPWVIPERGNGKRIVKTWFKKENINPHIAARVSGNEAIVAMVSLGFGCGIVSDLVLESSPFKKNIILIPYDHEINPYKVILAIKENRRSEPIINELWELIKKHI